jgi:protein-S-isoprenylcysteine O-methyltransferase Ste14
MPSHVELPAAQNRHEPAACSKRFRTGAARSFITAACHATWRRPACTVGLQHHVASLWLFRARETAICPTATTTTLITDDVYRLTRNPMYLGIVLILLGPAVAIGGLAYYVAALSFWLIIDFVFCPFEEAKLERDFPVAFAQYRNRVRRWL